MNKSDASRKIGGGEVKQAADTFTRDLLDKPKRGRPRKPDALTPAERARRYRAANKADPYRATRNAQPWYLAYLEEQKRREATTHSVPAWPLSRDPAWDRSCADARGDVEPDDGWNPVMMAAWRRKSGAA